MTDAFERYLLAKRSVDDRALDRYVLGRLREELAVLREELAVMRNGDGDGTIGDGEPPLRVVEVGAGIGTMIERCWSWGILTGRVRYTLVDHDASLLATARERLADWAVDRGYAVDDRSDDGLLIADDDRRFDLAFVAADASEYAGAHPDDADLLIAAAFLDLVDLTSTLPVLCSSLRPGGLCYFPITFDGGTILEPPVDPPFDDAVVAAYHRSMDERTVDGEPAGHSRTGRRLLTALPAADGEVLAVGGSDWVVHHRDVTGPDEEPYPADEAYFLGHLLDTVEAELFGDPTLDDDRFREWIAARRRQLDRGDLVYVAHQLDVLGRRRR